MQASVQFFGAGAPDAGPNTVLLTIDGRRYMFNCGPGTQRCALQHGLKFAHLEAVFFTSLHWEYYGGFKGMASSLADIHPYSTELETPEKNEGAHCCVGSEGEDDEKTEGKKTEVVEVKKGILPVIGAKGLQQLIDGSYSFLRRSIRFLKIVEQEFNSFYHDSLITVRPIFHNAFLKRVSTPSLSTTSSEEKRLRLASEESDDDDREVLIGYVVQGPSVPGKFDAKAARAKGVKPGPDFRKLLKGEAVTLGDGTVVTPEGIVSPGQAFPTIIIAEFKDAALPPYDIGIFFSAAQSTVPLDEQKDYCVERNLVPVLVDSFNLEKDLAEVSTLHTRLCSSEAVKVKPLDELVLFPESKYNSIEFGTSDHKNSEEIPERSVLTLGTGAAMPGKYRNVSSTLYLNDNLACLFDCGEATYGQLCRKFGFTNAQRVIDSLCIIGISHIHSDHHLGLLQVLEAKASERELTVYVPKDVLVFLDAYVKVHMARLSPFITLRENTEGEHVHPECIFELVPVDHCPNSYGFILKRPTTILAVYSGDTRPCDLLIEKGKNTELLIHEASMPDDLPEEAVYRKHCTAAEAVQVSQAMGAKLTVLSHLSQRYGRSIPTTVSPGKVLFASDFMTVPLNYNSHAEEEAKRTEVLNKE